MATKNANGASIWEIAHSAKRPLLGPEAVLRGSTPSTDTSTFCQRTIGKLRQQRVALMTAGRDGIAAIGVLRPHLVGQQFVMLLRDVPRGRRRLPAGRPGRHRTHAARRGCRQAACDDGTR